MKGVRSLRFEVGSWSEAHSGAVGLALCLPLVMLAAAVWLPIGAPRVADGVIVGFVSAETEQGSYPLADVRTRLGLIQVGLPRGNACRLGSRVTVQEWRTALIRHGAVTPLTPCLFHPDP